MKRALDVVVSAAGLVLLSPVLAVVAVAIKLDSPGPVLFRQRRIGRCRKSFEVVKFRTMRHRERIDQHARLAGEVANVVQVDLLPYHAFAGDKFRHVGRQYALADVPSVPAETSLQWVADLAGRLRVPVTGG